MMIIIHLFNTTNVSSIKNNTYEKQTYLPCSYRSASFHCL